MQKQTGAIILIAATCIGSGMIALPMLLVKLGIIPSVLLMLLIWSIIYYTSLVNIELNLQAGDGLSLGALGKKFSGKIAELIGTISFKILSYSLLAVYIYGGSSILQKILESSITSELSFNYIASFYALISITILLLPMKLLDYVNRILFTGMLAVVTILVAGIVSTINWSNLPLFTENYANISIWKMAAPVVFTTFGFQVIFHTLTNYCNKNAKLLKRAFFWGSLIPAIVYIIWTCSILGVIHQDSPLFYNQMINGEVEVGDLIKELSNIAKWPLVQYIIWCISSFAIITSVLGVGLGLCDTIKAMLPSKMKNRFLAAILSILPAYFLAIVIPNAFIAVLGFAGMILVVIAILLPIYLLSKLKSSKFYYPELKSKWLIILAAIAGILIIICELFNMANR